MGQAHTRPSTPAASTRRRMATSTSSIAPRSSFRGGGRARRATRRARALFTRRGAARADGRDLAAATPTSKSSFEGLLIDYGKRIGARVIVRGLRAGTDFEYELQIAHANADLRPEIDTVFLPTRTNYGFISASLVREIAQSRRRREPLRAAGGVRRAREEIQRLSRDFAGVIADVSRLARAFAELSPRARRGSAKARPRRCQAPFRAAAPLCRATRLP